MKWKTLCLTAALTAVLAAVPAYALDYTVDAPEDYLFGRPTSVETVMEYGTDNVDRSKNTALIPPAFGSPTSYLPNTGEPLTPNLLPGALSGGLVSSVGTVGSVTYTGAYVVMMTEYNLGLPFSDGIVWMYTGFTKTFGYFGIAAAFIFCARKENRRKTAAQLLPLAFTASLASITEPLDFLFCFTAPVLWLAHAVIAGAFIVLLNLCHVTAFSSNLLGSLLMNLSAGAARTHYPVLYLLGLAEIAVYFAVFTLLIKALDLPTPGRRPEEPAHPEKQPLPDDETIGRLIAALGGRENIRTVDNCFTRLRITVKDPAFVRFQTLRELPCSGVVQSGCEVQIVYGLQAAQIRQAVEQQLEWVGC